MKYFLAILLSGVCAIVSAQITITSSHMPKTGDTIRYSVALPTDLPDVNATGANHNWDFTDFGMVQQGVYEFKASYLTPYIINFGFTAIGLKIADSLGQAPMLLTNVYDFYKNSSTKYENIGMGFIPDLLKYPQSGKHSDPDEVYLFPLDYQDTFSSTFALDITLNAFGLPVGTFSRNGVRHTEVDGWGKVSTPYGSNIDCIRVKAVIDSYDSISIVNPPIQFGTDTRQVVYKWLSTSERIPVVEISGTEVAGNFIPQFIRYRDNYRAAPTPVAVDFTASQTNIYQGDTVHFKNNSEGQNLNYMWTIAPSTGWQYINGTSSTSENISVAFNDTGDYSVKLVARNNFFSDSSIKANYIHVNKTVGVEELFSGQLTFFPNPVNEELHIIWNGGISMRYSIVDITGKLARTGPIKEHEPNVISFMNIPEGLYSIIFEANGSVSVTRLIVHH